MTKDPEDTVVPTGPIHIIRKDGLKPLCGTKLGANWTSDHLVKDETRPLCKNCKRLWQRTQG